LGVSAVATVLGMEVRTEDPLPGVVAALKDKQMLLLLDSCEHVIDGAARWAAAVLSRAPGVNILATSREPLAVAGERRYRLEALSSPQPSSELTAAEAAAFPAVQLFVERVAATVEDFTLTDANAPLVAEICRRLDGLPWAIEFAAPRGAVLGVEGLAARLHYSLPLLGARRRATTPRHQTMRAVVDWSYGLLSENEQVFFRDLGIFSSGFTVEAVAAVGMDATNTRIDAIDRLADLVMKSLVVADVSGANPRFRLLDTTRAYAIEKLDKSGERERIARRHAEYYRDLFERAEGEAGARPAGEWLADHAQEIDNLRAALHWAFSPSGDGSIGVALTAAAVLLWMQLSLQEECRSWVKQALGALGIGGTQDPRQEMRLHAALDGSTPEVPEVGAAFTKALDIAESLGDSEYQLRALQGLYFFHAVSSRYRFALPVAQKFYDLAASKSDPNDKLFGERLVGSAEHYLGDHRSARRRFERVLSNCPPSNHRHSVIRFQFQTDLRVTASSFLARVLWLQGFSDQAWRAAEKSVEDAQATGHALSLCSALAVAACPIAFWVGKLADADRYVKMLLDQAREHSLPVWWSRVGSNFKGILQIKDGDLDAGLGLLRVGLDEIVDRHSDFRFSTGLSDLAQALAQAGRIAEALALLEAEVEHSEAGWLTPELLRLKGEFLLLQSTPVVAETAVGVFRQALDMARHQGALSWELRASTSLARLLQNQGRAADAIARLEPVYDRFTKGFGTADLITAKQLLDELSDAGRR
jgi:predicted ATPase